MPHSVGARWEQTATRQSGLARWDTLPPLPEAAAEAREVARTAPRSLARIGRDASEAALKRMSLSDVSVLHFASHAVVDPAGLRGTALLLSPGGGEDGIVCLLYTSDAADE